MKLTSKGKKILATTAIVLAVMSSSLVLTGCSMSTEERMAYSKSVVIGNDEYRVGELYLLTNKYNPNEQHICKSQKIGTYDGMENFFAADAFMYYDVESSEVLALNECEYDYKNISFNQNIVDQYSYEELIRISKLGTNNYKIKKYYETIINGVDKKIATNGYQKPLTRKQ